MMHKISCSYKNLLDLLQSKPRLSPSQKLQLRDSIDNDGECWKMWNKIRWDVALSSIGVKELKEYLGAEFIPYFDSSWALAREWNSRSRNTKESIEDFYTVTKNYIYNSVIFFESGDRIDLQPYFSNLRSKFNISSVIDFGCGVGNDGLFMLKEGVHVYFIDFESPTLDFLKWRLKKRDINSNMYDVLNLKSMDMTKVSSDMFWSVDVIEHMQNPMEIFDYISDSTKLVVYFTDADDTAKGRHPFHFKINSNKIADELINRGYEKVSHQVLNVWVKAT